MPGHKAQPAREHHLRHPALPYGRKRRIHGLAPRLAGIGLKRKRNGRALAGRRGSHHACEAGHAAGVHRAQRVHLQEAPAFVLDEHDFRQHEPQPRERRHQLVGRRGIGGVETVEREEHRRLLGGILASRDLVQRAALAVLVFHIAQTGQRDAAAESHVAAGTLLVVVDELVGEPFLQPAERIHHIRLNGHIARVNSGHLPSLSPSGSLIVASYCSAESAAMGLASVARAKNERDRRHFAFSSFRNWRQKATAGDARKRLFYMEAPSPKGRGARERLSKSRVRPCWEGRRKVAPAEDELRLPCFKRRPWP